MPSIKNARAMFEPNVDPPRQKRQSYAGPPRRQSTVNEPKENPFNIQLKSVRRESKPVLKTQPSFEKPELNHVFPDVQQPTRRSSITELKRRDSVTEKQRRDSTTQPPRKNSTEQPPRKDSSGQSSRKNSTGKAPRKISGQENAQAGRKNSPGDPRQLSRRISREPKIPVENGLPETPEPAKVPEPSPPPPTKMRTPSPVPPAKIRTPSPAPPPKIRTPSPVPPPLAPSPPPPPQVPAPPPPPPSKAPPPPPPPAAPPAPPIPEKKPMSEAKKAKVEKLKQRPRKRLDWHELMKEIESGVALKRTETNDRSRPIIPTARGKNGFVYQSEQPNLHNQLLNEIQKGVRLKRCRKVNDRSRPCLEGLRKLRRQLTVEEQQKAAEDENLPSSEDELDDIDKIRDSLQSTKQLLDEEVRTKNRLQYENMKLNDELEKLRKQMTGEESFCNGDIPESRKKQLMRQRGVEDDDPNKWENRCHETNKELFSTQNKLDEAENKAAMLEMALKKIQEEHGIQIPDIEAMLTNSQAPPIYAEPKEEEVKEEKKDESETEEEEVEEEEEEDEEIEVVETESDSDDEIPIMKDRSIEKEVSMLETRLRHTKEKERSAAMEKKSAKKRIVKLEKEMKTEKKKFKKLKKEVDEVAKMMADEGSDEEEKEKEEEEEEEPEEEMEITPTETEDEGSDEESDYEAKGSFEERKEKLQRKIKKSEEALQKKKKHNYRLKAHIDRILNNLSKERVKYKDMETELNTVLAELG